MEKKLLRVEIEGYEDQLEKLAYFLRIVDYLGGVGASRTLHLWVDGDGAARLNVNFPDMKEQPKVASNYLRTEEEKGSEKELRFYID